jgi:hypothetical protein
LIEGDEGDVRVAKDYLTSPGFRLAPCAKVARRATMRRRRMFFMVVVMV